MYAILKTGGKQYKVSEGDVIYVEKLGVEDGATVTFDEVLAVGAVSYTHLPLMKLPQRPMHWPISRPSAAMSHRPANDSFLKRL